MKFDCCACECDCECGNSRSVVGFCAHSAARATLYVVRCFLSQKKKYVCFELRGESDIQDTHASRYGVKDIWRGCSALCGHRHEQRSPSEHLYESNPAWTASHDSKTSR
jgi:hypothetical protein